MIYSDEIVKQMKGGMALGNSLPAESRVLLDLLANTLFDANIEINLSDINLGQLYAEAKAQAVLGLVFDALPSEIQEQDAETYYRWKFLAVSIIQRNIKQMQANMALENIFSEAGLPFCTIKGFASAYYYGGKKHLRQMGDIDFIVPDEKMEESKVLLMKRGFLWDENHGNHEFHWSFQKDDELYEMHRGITAPEDSDGWSRDCIAELFSDLKKADFDQGKITIPDIFSHGMIMLLHMKRHMLTGGGIGLRHLCDWAVFVNSFEDMEWTSVFEDKLKEANLWKFARNLSKTASLYLEINQKSWFADADPNMAQKLLSDILAGGNFGKKSIKRYQETSFISKKNGFENKWVCYLKGVLDRVYIWKPFYRKHQVLVPFGVVAYSFRILFLVLFRKKKLNIFALQKSGRRRNDLYEKLFR